MGYAGKYNEKQKAIVLRKKGYYYSEILKKINVSKDTLSRWCRDILLTKIQQQQILRRRIDGAKKGGLIAAENKKINRQKLTRDIIEAGEKEIGYLSCKEKFIVGVALYLGEGLKGDKEIGFTNSNPKIIKYMMMWFREFCKLSEDQFRGQLWIRDNLNENDAKLYWSNLTKIPLKQFRKTYIAKNKSDSKKIRKQLHKYGVIAIKISNVNLQRRILGWCAGILDQGEVKS